MTFSKIERNGYCRLKIEKEEINKFRFSIILNLRVSNKVDRSIQDRAQTQHTPS